MVEVDATENIKDTTAEQKDTLDIPKSIKSDSEISDDDDGG